MEGLPVHIDSARATGLSLLDRLKARLGLDKFYFGHYVEAREAGAPHTEVLKAHAHGIGLERYAIARPSEIVFRVGSVRLA
ncbi:hypothetical protein [Actinomadura mexicana]|uniref:Uncharacterized protein n=1 Tax=Actinomadura mexicana TaxID=134959 RepID=A0A238V0J3_9ACTN|nr:hypothetical protein [Actinomadura mexicana]SNR27564.1 hypothetical protein SAMN06265355_101686 [Actinomadura mexicana]